MTRYIAIETTTATKEEADKIACALVEQRLAACAQVSGPIESTYWWQGAVETSQEWRCRLKTKESRFAEVEAAIRALHAYTVPQIVAWPISHGSKDYLDWMETEVR
jgi:periplasmic divalent cation tolerance protein